MLEKLTRERKKRIRQSVVGIFEYTDLVSNRQEQR